MLEPTSTPSFLEHFGPEHSSRFVVFAPGDQGPAPELKDVL